MQLYMRMHVHIMLAQVLALYVCSRSIIMIVKYLASCVKLKTKMISNLDARKITASWYCW